MVRSSALTCFCKQEIYSLNYFSDVEDCHIECYQYAYDIRAVKIHAHNYTIVVF